MFAAVGLLAFAYLKVRETPAPEPAVRPESQDHAVAHAPDVPEINRGTAATTGRAEAAKPLTLHAMSETFRNTTFLIAIRNAGFVCDDVVAAHAGGERVWTATCRDMGGYAINVRESGELTIQPSAQYFDTLNSVRPILDDGFRLERNPPRELLEQERQR
jgi:hypothetical protein